MNNVLLYLSLILTVTIISSGFINENFSNADDKIVKDYIKTSEENLVGILKNILGNNSKLPIIEGPKGDTGSQGSSGSIGPLQPQYIYNKKHKNNIVSVQDILSNSNVSSNIAFMIDKPDDRFSPSNSSKWTLVKGDSDYLKIQSVKHPEKCLSYDNSNKIFLAGCTDAKYYSDWKQDEHTLKAVNITANEKCLSTINMRESDKKKDGISSDFNNILKLDVCLPGEKQSWLFE